MKKIKYKIKKDDFFKEIMSLGDDEGAYCGWGRFIETDNQKLKEFFNEYLFIEHESFSNGSSFCIGRYSDVADYFWEYDLTKSQYVKLFDNLIKDAVANTGIYEGFDNEF